MVVISIYESAWEFMKVHGNLLTINSSVPRTCVKRSKVMLCYHKAMMLVLIAIAPYIHEYLSTCTMQLRNHPLIVNVISA